MLAEMPDADDRDSDASDAMPRRHEATKDRFDGLRDLRAFVAGRAGDQVTGRPTMQMPASSAALMIASPSIISVLPGVDRQRVAPAAFIASIVDDADHRHVEAHVLIRLGDLDDADAGAGELAGARDHRVGPFHRLDRDDRRPLDGDRLADVERRRSRRRCGSRTRNRPAPRRSARARVRTPVARQQRRQKGGRVEQLDAVVAQHVGDAGDQRVGVLRLCSRISTPSSVRSGTMSANSFVCLTCPAITACVTPAAFSSADALCRAGRARSSGARRPAAAPPASASSGTSLPSSATTVTSWPGAARGVEDEKRETGRCRRSGQRMAHVSGSGLRGVQTRVIPSADHFLARSAARRGAG